MTVTISGTSGITTPDVTSDSYTGPISVSAAAPSNSVQLNASGNLGLGVTPSAWGSGYKAFEVNGGAFWSYSANECDVYQNCYFNGTSNIYKTSAAASRYEQNTGRHAWYTAPSGTAGNAISFTQAMTLDASGNLLVGTTSGGSGKIRASGGSDAFNSPYANPSSGYFFSSNSADATCVEIYQGRYNKAALAISGNNTGTLTAIQFYEAGSAVGSVTTTTSSTAYNTSSDYRLKNTIAPMTGALAKVALLKPCTYKWNVDGSDGEGFIAHELAEVCPHAVTGEKDATRVEQYEVTPAVFDDNGQVVTPAVMGERTVPVYQGIDTSFLVATLTAAIQEQQAIIDSLTTRIAALEAK